MMMMMLMMMMMMMMMMMRMMMMCVRVSDPSSQFRWPTPPSRSRAPPWTCGH
jgi:hypothetical protein